MELGDSYHRFDRLEVREQISITDVFCEETERFRSHHTPHHLDYMGVISFCYHLHQYDLIKKLSLF